MAFKPRKINGNLTGSPVAVINKVRQYANDDYKNAVPYATENANVLRQIGAILSDNPILFNEFANTLYNQIGYTWFASNLFWENPWTFADRGALEQGEIVQEIYVGLCLPYKYDPAVAEKEWMKREVPDVKSAFHPVNWRHYYKSTIQRDSISMAFNSVSSLEQFISEVIGQMILSAEYDQFHSLMYLYAISIQNGLIPTVTIPEADTEEDMKNIIAVMRQVSNDMTFMSNKYTITGVKAHTPKEKQHLIISNAVESLLDVNVLASAFNLSYTDYVGNRVLSPSFANMDVERLDILFGYMTFNESTGEWETTPEKAEVGYHHFTAAELEELDSCYALLSDEDFWQCYTRLTRSATSPENGQGLYVNNWYHLWKTMAVSPFKNACAFCSTIPTVDTLTLNTNAVTLSAGAGVQLIPTVTTSGFASKSVKWESSDTSVATVDDAGNVIVSPTAEAEDTCNIVCTSVKDSTKTATCVITVA